MKISFFSQQGIGRQGCGYIISSFLLAVFLWHAFVFYWEEIKCIPVIKPASFKKSANFLVIQTLNRIQAFFYPCSPSSLTFCLSWELCSCRNTFHPALFPPCLVFLQLLDWFSTLFADKTLRECCSVSEEAFILLLHSIHPWLWQSRPELFHSRKQSQCSLKLPSFSQILNSYSLLPTPNHVN